MSKLCYNGFDSKREYKIVIVSVRSDKILNKIWSFFVSIILFIEIIMICIIFVPRLFGIKAFVVTSGSMIPKYPVGSLVYAKKDSYTNIKKGDSITFYMSDSNIVATHEVYDIDIENKLFYTQGINNKDDNGNIIHDAMPVENANIIGKTIFCIPYIGFINVFLTTSPGMYIIIAFTLTIILISFIIEKTEIRKEEVQNEKK